MTQPFSLLVDNLGLLSAPLLKNRSNGGQRLAVLLKTQAIVDCLQHGRRRCEGLSHQANGLRIKTKVVDAPIVENGLTKLLVVIRNELLVKWLPGKKCVVGEHLRTPAMNGFDTGLVKQKAGLPKAVFVVIG